MERVFMSLLIALTLVTTVSVSLPTQIAEDAPISILRNNDPIHPGL
ncbi:hypothetical protein KQI76_08150 [Amphibacillus sp. MSJ-3]|nr:hypothetical protein [Amphibacillus sp. MSJ-3]MBU5595135.1 hypothetical protein [Amphibacillus sp. MSJ-3]